MTATLWIDTDADETLDLGDTLGLYQSFSQMSNAAGGWDTFQMAYPALAGLVDQVESQDDADPLWLTDAALDAIKFKARHGGQVDGAANAVLGLLADAPARFAVTNAFCATGPGGGVDPTCSPQQGKFSVGDVLKHTSKVLGESPVEFRGYHDHAETGEKVARVIFRRPGEMPFESSVPIHELSPAGAPEPAQPKPADPYFHPDAVRTRDTAGVHESQGRARLRLAKTAKDRKEAEKWLESSRHLKLASEQHRQGNHHIAAVHETNADRALDGKKPLRVPTTNAFCATGPGGGVDPSCSPGGGKGGGGANVAAKANEVLGKIASGELKDWKSVQEVIYGDKTHMSSVDVEAKVGAALGLGSSLKSEGSIAGYMKSKAKGAEVEDTPPGPTQLTPPPVKTASPDTAPAVLPPVSGLKFVQSLPGSTGPRLMQDPQGNKWVVKDNPDRVKQQANEAQADALYRAAGVAVPQSGLSGGAKVSAYLEGAQTLGQWREGKSPSQVEAMHGEIAKGFAMDALTANWDVVGQSSDNILIHEGKPVRADNGGALLYRAQGTPKGSQFGATVGELSSMRDAYVNKAGSQVFGKLTDADVRGQMIDVLGKRDQILGAVKDDTTKETLGKRLDYYQQKVNEGYGLPKANDKAHEPEAGSPKGATGYAGTVTPATDAFSSAEGLANHIKSNAGSVKYTDLYFKKLKVLNPQGIQNGVFHAVGASPDKMAHTASLLPAGTVIKHVHITKAHVEKLEVEGGQVSITKSGDVKKDTAKETQEHHDTAVKGSVGKSTPPGGHYKDVVTTGATVHASSEYKEKYPNPLKEIDAGHVSPPPSASAQAAWHATMSGPQKDAVRSWTGTGYSAMRGRIRDGKPDAEDKAFLATQVKAPVYEGTSYRGLHGKGAEAVLKSMLAAGPGGKWADGAPMSTSRDLGVAHREFGHGDVMLVIHGKTGRSMETKSIIDDEKEIVTMPGAKYRIKEVSRDVALKKDPTKTPGYDKGKHYWYKGYAVLEEI